MPHYRLIPDIYLEDRGSGVSQVRFDITGANGMAPSSVSRLYNVYGFMGPGVAVTPQTPSGLDINNPTWRKGYAFTGQILNQNVSGNESWNGGTGWGAVYGIVTGQYFGSSLYDTCLIDNTPWYQTGFSGFSGSYGIGSYPNPTGDFNLLYWPVKGSGLGLRITGVQYYLNGYGNLSDPLNYFTNGNYQMINDVTYSGYPLTGTNATTTDLYQYNGGSNLMFFSSGNFPPMQASEFYTGTSGPFLSFDGSYIHLFASTGLYNGAAGSNLVQFLGFNINTGNQGNWGYNQSLTASQISSLPADYDFWCTAANGSHVFLTYYD